MDTTKVLLIATHELSREGLKLLLTSDGYDVIGAVRSLEEGRAAVADGLRPELVLLVLVCPGDGDSAASLLQARAGFSVFKFVVIAPSSSAILSARCIAAGINGCLLLDMSPTALTQSLRLVMLGQEIFPGSGGMLPREGGHLSVRADGPDAECTASPLPGSRRSLSAREGEILGKLLLGHSNKMIARELLITEATVKVHLKGLLRKLKARNRTQAAIWALENGYGERPSA
jgi:two-component system nitrate/nitrite response regulator NarL